jgi:hypothetical protein
LKLTERRYKDKNDDWQSTQTLNVNDLPKAVMGLQKVYEYLVLKDVSGNNRASESKPSSNDEVIE